MLSGITAPHAGWFFGFDPFGLRKPINRYPQSRHSPYRHRRHQGQAALTDVGEVGQRALERVEDASAPASRAL